MFKKICPETARFASLLMDSQMGRALQRSNHHNALRFKNSNPTTYISIRTQPIETKKLQP